MRENVLLTVALLIAALVVLGSLGDRLNQRNRGRHDRSSRRISTAIVLTWIVAVVAGLRWIW